MKGVTRKTIQTLLDDIADPTGRDVPQSARHTKLLSEIFNFAPPRDFGVDFTPVLG